MNSYSNIFNKQINVVPTSRTLKLKSECSIDGNAITNIFYSKLCLFISTPLGPSNILEYVVLYFKFYLVTSTRLREWRLRCTNFVENILDKNPTNPQKRDRRTSNITSARPINTRCGAAVFAPLSLSLPYLQHFTIRIAVCPGPMAPPVKTGQKTYFVCVRALPLDIFFSQVLFLCKF